MKCDKCGYDYSNSGDSAHVCFPVNLKKTMVIFDKHYSDESLIDLEGHIADALSDNIAGIPRDEYGFLTGTFRVTINWSEE